MKKMTFFEQIKITLILFLLCFAKTSEAVQVSFNVSDSVGCAPLSVTFTNTSTDTTGITFIWQYGDGTIDTSFHGQHTYTGGGYHTAQLLADSNGTTLSFKSIDIHVKALGIYSPTDGSIFCPEEPVTFYTYVYYNTDSIFWDFGDGNSGTGNFATHHYDSIGDYTYTGLIYGECGIDTISALVKIHISLGPVFNINVSSYNTCVGDAIHFGTSYSGIEYLWHFPDSSTSNSNSPSFSFDSLGTYDVWVAVKDYCGVWGYDTVTITVDSTTVPNMSQISSYPSTACPNTLISFTGSTPGDYYWNLGDGTVTTGDDFDYGYSDTGAYTVFVKVTNGCGFSDSTTFIQVIAYDTLNMPFANIYFSNNEWWLDTLNTCPGLEVSFNNYSYNDAYTTNHWEYGDGTISTNYNGSHIYTTPGNYVVTYTVTNNCMGSAYVTKYVVVDSNLMPTDSLVAIPPVICPGENVYFYTEQEHEHSSYSIWFGDNDSLINIPAVDSSAPVHVTAIHTYDMIGTYPYTFSVTNECGNTKTTNGTILVSNSNPFPFFFYNHSAENDSVCPGDEVEFFAVGGVDYSWNWNDGSPISSGQTPTHAFDTIGTYYPELTITTGCGLDSTIILEVHVANGMLPYPFFSFTSGWQSCAGDSITMEPYHQDANYDYYWQFPNGMTSTDMMPSVVINSGGFANVMLTVTNGCGSDSTTNSVSVISIDIVESSATVNPTLCDQSTGSITGVDINDPTFINNYIYTWTNANGDTIGFNENIYNLDLGYYTLDVQTPQGCMAESAVFLLPSAQNPGIPTYSGNTAVCNGDSVGPIMIITTPGADITWYSDLALTDSINNVDTLSFALTQSTQLYVTQTVNGCEGFPTLVDLMAYPLYNETADAQICFDDSIMLGGAYQTTPGMYIDTLASIHGCDSIVTTTLAVVAFESAGTGGSVTLCDTSSMINLTALLDSTASSSGLWMDYGSGGLIGVDQFNPQIVNPGTHIVTYLVSNTCASDSAVFTFVVNDCDTLTVGFGELHKLNWRIYPNPNQGRFTLNMLEYKGAVQMDVINAQGQIVDQKQYFSNQEIIDLQYLSNGIYMLNIRNHKHQVMIPVMLNK